MKCILCQTVQLGAGNLLLGKHCACGRCVRTYNELLKAASTSENPRITELLKLAKNKIDAYREEAEEPPLLLALRHAEAYWKMN